MNLTSRSGETRTVSGGGVGQGQEKSETLDDGPLTSPSLYESLRVERVTEELLGI